jgi:hypothetical protein
MTNISGMNSALNACISLIEGRTDIAKEIIRAPGSDVKNVPEILARLEQAVNRTAAKAIRNVLVRTLSVKPPAFHMESQEEAFFIGVTSIESILDQAVDELEA